jgi:SAM-dependent methyltransferase
MHELNEHPVAAPPGFPEDLFDKQIHCPLCGVTGNPPADVPGFSHLCSANGVYVFANQTFSVYQCDKCGLGVTSPRVSARYVPILYKIGSPMPFSDEEGFVDPVHRFFFRQESRRWLRWLGKTGMPARSTLRVLDFGTGSGLNAIAFADVLGDKGRVWASDFQTAPPSRIRGNARVSYLAHEALNESGGLFEIIHLRHMLEHEPDPLSFLLRMRGLLSAGGSLFIEVPGLYPALHRFTMKHIPELFQSSLPYHYYFFTPESLGELLSRAGFTSEFKKTNIPVIGRLLQARTGQMFAGKRYLPLFVLGILLYPLQWLYANLLGLQPTLRVIARKTEESVRS